MAKKKKSTKKSPTSEKSDDEISKKLYDWVAEGYEIGPLVEVVQGKDEEEIAKMFKKYEENIKKMEGLKKRLAKLEFDRENARFQEMLVPLSTASATLFLRVRARRCPDGSCCQKSHR